MDQFSIQESGKGNDMQTTTMKQHETIQPLRQHVIDALDRYYNNLNGTNKSGDLHDFVFDEVEAALYESVMRYTKGNQSLATRMLGVNRGTLRTKLMKYFGTTHVGVKRASEVVA